MKKLLVVTGLVLSSILSYGQSIQVEFQTLRYNSKLISISKKLYTEFSFNKNLLTNNELIELLGIGYRARLNKDIVTLTLHIGDEKMLPKFLTYTREETLTVSEIPTIKKVTINDNLIPVIKRVF